MESLTRAFLAINVSIAPQDLLWVFIVACIFSFAVAYGLGANNIANSFATSFGSGAIKYRYIIICGGIMETLGAISLGWQVAKTIRTGIADLNCFTNDQSTLMLVMTTSLIGCSIWIIYATILGLPNSITHSIISSIVGTTVAAKGWGCINWGINGFSAIIISWLISPILAGILGIGIYASVLKFIIKATYPEKNAYRSIPYIIGIIVFIILAVIFINSPITANLDVWIQWIIVVGGTLIFVLAAIFGGKLLIKKLSKIREKHLQKEAEKKKNKEDEEDEENEKQDSQKNPKEINDIETDQEEETSDEFNEKKSDNDKMKEISSESDKDSNNNEEMAIVMSQQIQPNRLEKETLGENIFYFYQMITANVQSFTHGSHDTLNAVAPLTTVYFIFTAGQTTGTETTPIWLLFLGGVGITIGIATLGKIVTKTMGRKLSKINFSRGFSMELGAAIAGIIASRIGMPISSTHTQVGSVVFVSLFTYWIRNTSLAPAVKEENPFQDINWKLFGKIAFSWVITIPVSAMISAGFYSVLQWLITA
jgi:sodium-dependent phosphate transporter